MTETMTGSLAKGAPGGPPEAPPTIRIHVEVEANGPPEKVEFDASEVTGRAIKDRAGVPLDHDLAKREGQKLVLVTNDETITIKNGDHFVSLPPGTIS